MTDEKPDYTGRYLDERGWLVSEHAGKVFKRVVSSCCDGTICITIEFEDATELSMLLAIRPFISFESARIEEGALQDIQSSRPQRWRPKSRTPNTQV